MSISIGSRVRSFDFAGNLTDGTRTGRDLEGERACFVEGEVVAFDHQEGCKRYRILVDYDVFGGEESSRRVGTLVYPPVNGTPSFLGGVTDFVEELV